MIIPVVEQAIRLRQRYGKPSVLWMQVGIIHQDAAKRAEASGFQVVMDRCLRTEHQLRSYRRSLVH
jgi:predicted CoA-binding protein